MANNNVEYRSTREPLDAIENNDEQDAIQKSIERRAISTEALWRALGRRITKKWKDEGKACRSGVVIQSDDKPLQASFSEQIASKYNLNANYC
ncbi:hypothetical protein [Chlorobaculum tepidum]|nr:hypothetical protein [Chlorobaculum tepidum]